MVQTSDTTPPQGRTNDRPNDPAQPSAWTRNRLRDYKRAEETGQPENEVAWYAGPARNN